MQDWQYLDLDEWDSLVSQGLDEHEICEKMGYLDLMQFRVDLAIARINRSRKKEKEHEDFQR